MKMFHNIYRLIHKPLNIHSQKKSEQKFWKDISDINQRGEALRKKDIIKVLFILPNLPKWKTESLYKAMLAHPRFEPMIGVAVGTTDYPSEVINKITTLESYLNEKHYPFIELSSSLDIKENAKPDIIFYQEAGGCGGLNNSLQFQNQMNCLFCYVSYGFNTVVFPFEYETPYQNHCWLWFVENETVKQIASSLMRNKGKNVVVTGFSQADDFLNNNIIDLCPWKSQEIKKKRIIWAPHHTIGVSYDALHYGNFLEIADFMVELAEKTKNDVQWAFKPHPVLKQKLQFVWGKEKTHSYYQKWANMENTQLELGPYVRLFKCSDAIIHDSGSFTVEYLYTHKPCMYIVNGQDHSLNSFGQKAYDMYYKGHNREDIEQFVQNVIDDIDPRKEEREQFFKDYLLPPNGRTACENIIAAILGESPYGNI